ncbi:AraC family transcriptional regulator [Acinetobacter sp. GSS19]|uniref:AraC family transcriptional regulator n=1 Tax=Acinetobacter sp. GSS19 TaxID=3020716 RepID=UPI0023611C21|nr:AraC family transcriptional regulator [Acinetobacter sp. GSS19]
MDRHQAEQIYPKGTISIGLVHEALMAAYSQGLNTTAILQQAGISNELLQSAKARLPVSMYAELWIALADAMNDEFFGMDSHPMRRGSYQLLAKLLIQSENLQKALQDCCRFMNLILDDIRAELSIDDEQAYLTLHDRQGPKRMFSYATYIMLVHGLMCWLTEQRVVLKQMSVRCKQPKEIEDYRVRFCQNIEFNATENRITFDAQYLQLKIKKDKKSLYEFLQQTPHNLLVRYKNPNSLSLQLRRQLMERSPEYWPELGEIAEQQHMSEATLQRRLKHENTSYQQLKNDIRRDIAIERLSKSQDSIQDISDALSFHDPSAFHRAFKKWTGVSPGAYRQLQQTPD